MRPTWGALLSLAAICGAEAGSARAQDVAPNSSSTALPGSVVYYEDPVADGGFLPPNGENPLMEAAASSYGFLRKDLFDGVGYEDGATVLGGFAPLALTRNSILFLQPQVFVTDVGEGGLNVGGGYRSYMPNADRVIGIYGFYDNDDSLHGHRRDQLSIGFETLGRMWDFRVNGYFPLDDDEDLLGFDPQTQLAIFEQQMGGADIEFGIPIFDPSAFGRLRAYFGLYAYDSNDRHRDDPAGARVRLEAHLNEHATVNAAFMTDDRFGDMVTLGVELRSWNSRLPGMNNQNLSNRAKLYLPAVRVYRIANETYLD